MVAHSGDHPKCTGHVSTVSGWIVWGVNCISINLKAMNGSGETSPLGRGELDVQTAFPGKHNFQHLLFSLFFLFLDTPVACRSFRARD